MMQHLDLFYSKLAIVYFLLLYNIKKYYNYKYIECHLYRDKFDKKFLFDNPYDIYVHKKEILILQFHRPALGILHKYNLKWYQHSTKCKYLSIIIAKVHLMKYIYHFDL